MSSPPSRKSGPVAPAPAETTDLLPILVTRHVLTAEQAERVRRASRVGSLGIEQAIKQLGVANEIQIAQALAAHAGLPYVKINPLDLDIDVVTKGLSAPFARKHGLVAIAKSGDKITIAVHDPFAPFPTDDIKRVTGLDVERVVATRTDVETVNKGFYDLQTSLQTAEKQLSASRMGAGPADGLTSSVAAAPPTSVSSTHGSARTIRRLRRAARSAGSENVDAGVAM